MTSERASSTPRALHWHEAADVILAASRAFGDRVVIGVTGSVAAGKSTLARRLSDTVVSTDHYLPNYDETPEALRDLAESSDLEALARNIAALRAGCATDAPVWSFESHRREGMQRIEPARVVVVEGLHALHALPRAHLDIAVFVEASQPTRWSRAAAREAAGDRPWTREYLEHFFYHVAEPTFALHAAAYRSSAHFIVVNDARDGITAHHAPSV
jgi:uridine kinase